MKDNLIKAVFLLLINALILNVADMRGKSHITRMPDYFFHFTLCPTCVGTQKPKKNMSKW